ncbi:hypothetical protein RHMOL_Rhmol03G0199900 [Rhododendron molle]|uniref:Uncharacterized protein n=1 Tax=Rhododendron molle TaxID=49168 RepID=A0ACC0PI24_RHOML|nr:hypothetical protein RHMOL_Rhmol03G0199900 [Rhododendron molle]
MSIARIRCATKLKIDGCWHEGNGFGRLFQNKEENGFWATILKPRNGALGINHHAGKWNALREN